MRKWFGIMGLVFLCSCAGEYRHEMPNRSTDAMTETVSVSENEQYTLLLTNKLQETLELTQLKLAHPEFDVSIQDSLFFADNRKKYTEIATVEVVERSAIDTYDLVKIAVVFKKGNTEQRDTLTAKITSKELSLGDETVVTRTIEFIE